MYCEVINEKEVSNSSVRMLFSEVFNVTLVGRFQRRGTRCHVTA